LQGTTRKNGHPGVAAKYYLQVKRSPFLTRNEELRYD
jgi:hypothetical protein